MLIVGLTGSIGMGKSTIAAMFRERGVAVFDADAEVHRLYEGAAVPLIEDAFPGTTRDGRVDRPRLAAALGTDAAHFKTLEGIVHPLVNRAERAFLAAEKARGAKLAVLEIPLLYETGLDRKMDAVIVASATSELQRARVLARTGMTDARLAALLARQVADDEKRRRADFIVDTSTTLGETAAAIDAIIAKLGGAPAVAFDRDWR